MMDRSRRILLPATVVLLASLLVMSGLAASRSGQIETATHAITPGETVHMGGSPSAASLSAELQRHPPVPTNYDEQLGITFTQNFNSLEYNVTAVEQVDPTLDTGPGYLLSGVSSVGYWFQVGLSYNWSPGDMPGTGFAMSYEVFNSQGNSIFPANGGGGLTSYSGTINPGDNVTIQLYFSAGFVVMAAHDVNTGASATEEYPAGGATYFLGLNSDANAEGFFTGLMTEWYHGEPYYSNPAEVIYSANTSVSSAYLWMDEFNANNGQVVFTSNATAVTTFTANPTQLQLFSYESITEYSDAFEFVTGPLSGSTTTSSSSTTSSSVTTSIETVTVGPTQTVTTTVPVTVTQTATATATTTVTQPVTATVTVMPPTVTVTTTSVPAPSVSTTTQTATQTVTAPASTVVPTWAYALMGVLLLAGITAGYLIRRPASSPREVQPPDSPSGL